MDDFFEELKTLKVITKKDITKLRQYILNKYPQYDDGKRASMLIITIRNIVDQHLMDFSLQYRQPIRDQLLQRTLVANQDGIFLFDILKTFLSLDTIDDILIDELCSWTNKHISNTIDRNDLLTYRKDYLYVVDNTIDIVSEKNLDKPSPTNQEVSQTKVEESTKAHTPSKDTKLIYIIGLTLILFLISGVFLRTTKGDEQQEQEPLLETAPVTITYKYNHLPENFYYKHIDEEKLKGYLSSRNSLLEKEPYFTSIIEVAREFELNPLVLFAIAGHEQGFVPKDHPSAPKIANNPFNVFHSWQDYNTDITDSSKIAARTVINLSKDRPESMDPFQWINRKYAEDKNWWLGVKSIYNKLEEEIQ